MDEIGNENICHALSKVIFAQKKFVSCANDEANRKSNRNDSNIT